ncbi:MAG: phage holin family protein [Nitrosomonadales bacterium]
MSAVNSGLLGSVRRLLSTLTSVASTRLALLANELYEERLQLEQMLLYFFTALFCFGMGILLLTTFVVMLFWDTYRLAVLGGLGALFVVSGLLLANKLVCISRRKTTLFSASLAELAVDRERLDGAHD